MTDLDETDLIAFFGVLPEEQPAEEREFFGSTAFVVRAGDLELRCDVSLLRRDVFVDMIVRGEATGSFWYRLRGVETARIEPDAAGRSWLRFRSSRGDELGLSVEPDLAVRIRGSDEGDREGRAGAEGAA